MAGPLSVGIMYILKAGFSWVSPVSTKIHQKKASKFLPICIAHLILDNLISQHIISEILTKVKCKIISDGKLENLRNTIHPHNAVTTICQLFHCSENPRLLGICFVFFSWINDTYFPITELGKLGQISCNNSLP
jgi:hypothetical protein